jgi:hypothetical protein
MNSASGLTQRGVVFDSVLAVDHFTRALTVQAQVDSHNVQFNVILWLLNEDEYEFAYIVLSSQRMTLNTFLFNPHARQEDRR